MGCWVAVSESHDSDKWLGPGFWLRKLAAYLPDHSDCKLSSGC